MVSAVIPTHGRPTLLARAIASVAMQADIPLEIIVVIDGPDDGTERALASIEDERVRIVRLPRQGGPGRARNAGARAARAPWVAFLDDDDEWLAEKLSRQLQLAEGARVPCPIVCCAAFVNTPTGRFIWPRRQPRPDEPLSEYIFCRRSLFRGEGYVSTSSLLVPRKLLEELPYIEDREMRFEDLDWLLRAAKAPGTTIIAMPEPLHIVHTEGGRSFSSAYSWRKGLEWGRGVRSLMTPRAFASFCLFALGSQAAASREWKTLPLLLREAFRGGRPTVFELGLFFLLWLIPRDLRRRLRGLLQATGVPSNDAAPG